MPKLEDLKFKCHCGDWRFKNAFSEVDDIRDKVCRDLPFYGKQEGKEYCVLHFPEKDKVEDFEIVIKERLNEDIWDFRMVYFPKSLSYEREEFVKRANFNHATFADTVNFKWCKFRERFEFFNAVFKRDAVFICSDFYKSVSFNSAEFQEYGNFGGVTFHPESYPSFNNTKFKNGSFIQTTFEDINSAFPTKFEGSEFSKRIDFSHTKIYSKISFENAVFPANGTTNFKSAEFHQAISFENVSFFKADFTRAKFAIISTTPFNQIVFKNCRFNKSVHFVDSRFFVYADFSESIFENTHFENAKFRGGAGFKVSDFKEDLFLYTTEFGLRTEDRLRSGDVSFEGALFESNSRVFFENTWFSRNVNFDFAYVKGYLFFSGSKKNKVFDNVFEERSFGYILKLLYTTIEKPERVHFHTLRLRPSWFINIDVREFSFINVDWRDENGNPITIESELERINGDHTLLAITLRQLATNFEKKNRFGEASKFRKMAFETEYLQRKEKARKWWSEEIFCRDFFTKFWDKLKDVPWDVAHRAYRFTSYYGESWVRALIIFLFIPLVFGLLYYFLDVFGGDDSKKFGDYLAYSLQVMTLQRPEPKPIGFWTTLIYSLEIIFAPIQLALLALALRRKFMR